jgi:hypothetical protein
MAANSQNAENQIESLVLRADAARNALGDNLLTLRHKADVPSRIKEKIRSHPILVFGSTALGGLILARLFFRKSPRPAPPTPPTPRRGIKNMLFQVLCDSAKPAIQAWLIQQVKKSLSDRIQKAQTHPSKR